MPERKIILGVDPGLGGALALLDGDGGLVVHDMPTHKPITHSGTQHRLRNEQIA